jgi:hypothetical protein
VEDEEDRRWREEDELKRKEDEDREESKRNLWPRRFYAV